MKCEKGKRRARGGGKAWRTNVVVEVSYATLRRRGLVRFGQTDEGRRSTHHDEERNCARMNKGQHAQGGEDSEGAYCSGMPILQKRSSTRRGTDSTRLQKRSRLSVFTEWSKTGLTRCEIVDLPLKSTEVPQERNYEHAQAQTRAPPDDGVADEVVFDTVVVPAVHSHSVPEERPLEWTRRDRVLLVRVGDERVVRGHHCDIEMPEIAEEGRAVELLVAGGDCETKVKIRWQERETNEGEKNSRRSFQ